MAGEEQMPPSSFEWGGTDACQGELNRGTLTVSSMLQCNEMPAKGILTDEQSLQTLSPVCAPFLSILPGADFRPSAVLCLQYTHRAGHIHRIHRTMLTVLLPPRTP